MLDAEDVLMNATVNKYLKWNRVALVALMTPAASKDMGASGEVENQDTDNPREVESRANSGVTKRPSVLGKRLWRSYP